MPDVVEASLNPREMNVDPKQLGLKVGNRSVQNRIALAPGFVRIECATLAMPATGRAPRHGDPLG